MAVRPRRDGAAQAPARQPIGRARGSGRYLRAAPPGKAPDRPAIRHLRITFTVRGNRFARA
ncbi:hypothetical protein Pen02_44330 [Plantactinospora endophytica]|uniref:Uncharacterized protein n=1 Tax=Plantactinospora endophytica TaxID=673535 RepID=A0ABQ4E472_9ACTN|nr:hypothetical protein Pen02_44330 [Plantactinospora endophytica]